MPTYRITAPYTAKSRPIIFNAEMIRAIRDWRKTQTRRVIKVEWSRCLDLEEPEDLQKAIDQCPYGVPGDFFWVRETWATGKGNNFAKPSELARGSIIFYKDGEWEFEVPKIAAFQTWTPPERGKWRPSIFMPRWASRISLRIVEIKVERVQEIDDYDAIKEGVEPDLIGNASDLFKENDAIIDKSFEHPSDFGFWKNPKEKFAELWDSINAKKSYGWDENPWVWVIEFERIKDE